MKINVNDTKLLRYLVAVVVIVVALLVVILMNYSKTSSDINNLIQENIASTNWPEEVPIIKRSDVKVDKYVSEKDSNKISWTIRMKNGVSYTEFRDYLLELEEAGFEPVKELGSKSPRLLITAPLIDDEEFYLFWYGDLNEYRVEVFWQDLKGAVLTEDDYLEYCFTITLYKNMNSLVSGDSTEIISGDSDVDESLISGDVSGDIIEPVSGDIIDDSGDRISGDNISGGEILEDMLESGELVR